MRSGRDEEREGEGRDEERGIVIGMFIWLTVCLSLSGAPAAVGCCGGGGEGNTTW